MAHIFDLSALEIEGRTVVRDYLECCDFPWARLRDRLQSWCGVDRVPVRRVDLSKQGYAAQTWTPYKPRWRGMEIDLAERVHGAYLGFVFGHETGHLIDPLWPTNTFQMHQRLARLYGAPWKEMGHSVCGALATAFSCYQFTDDAYPWSVEKIQKLRVIYGGDGPPPEKTVT